MNNNLTLNTSHYQFNNIKDAVITEDTILAYFCRMNSEEFVKTSQLFAENGMLYPPFEPVVTGRKAIADYLEREAKGLKLFPNRCITEGEDTGNTIYLVTGIVQTSLFSVNVAWNFVLNCCSEIVSAEIKLLASLEELLHIKNKRDRPE